MFGRLNDKHPLMTYDGGYGKGILRGPRFRVVVVFWLGASPQ